MSLYPSTVCTEHSSQRDRQATSGERPVEGRPPFFLVSPCSLRLSSHPERGSGEVGVVGQTGPAVRPQTSECVYVGGREGSTGLITDPTTHWASQTATSQPAAATE